MSSDSRLKSRFLDSTNRLQWGDLGGAIFGVGLYQAIRGIAGIPLGIAAAIDRTTSSITDALTTGTQTLTSTLTAQADAAFGAVDFGVASLPVTAVAMLVSITIVVYGYREVVL